MESNIQIVEKPDWVTWDDIKQIISDRQEKIHTETLVQSIKRIVDTTPVSFDKEEVEAEYDDTKIIRYDEPPERLTEKQSEHITVAVGTISEKQAGCTMTALEIAFMLLKQKQSVAVFLEDETYERYIEGKVLYVFEEVDLKEAKYNLASMYERGCGTDKNMYLFFQRMGCFNSCRLSEQSPAIYKRHKLHLFSCQSGNLFKIQSANDKRTLQGFSYTEQSRLHKTV